MGTGHHAAVNAGVEAGSTVVVIGDGAVGLCGVLAARRLGAERIIAVGHHEDRLELAEEFGATETVSERGEAAVERIQELTHGGPNHVMECVGAASAMNTAIDVVRPGRHDRLRRRPLRRRGGGPSTCSECSATTSHLQRRRARPRVR